jgi:hypothetical protein
MTISVTEVYEEALFNLSARHRNGPLQHASRDLTSTLCCILPSTGAARSSVARQPGRLCVQELACQPRNQTTAEKRA